MSIDADATMTSPISSSAATAPMTQGSSTMRFGWVLERA
jgi:hypothetical protein